MEISLDGLKNGGTAIVRRLENRGRTRQRLQDLGLVPGTVVKCLGRSPFGDPAAYLIKGAVIAIRDEDSRGVRVMIPEEGERWDWD